MATAYASQASKAYGPIIGQGLSHGVMEYTVQITPTTTQIGTINNTIDLMRVPKGTVILGARLETGQLDTNASPTLTIDIGDSGNAARIFSASTVGQTGANTVAMPNGAFGYKYATESVITLKVHAAPATAASAAIIFTLFFKVDESFSLTSSAVA